MLFISSFFSLFIGKHKVEWIVEPLMLKAATPVGAITSTGDLQPFPAMLRSRPLIALMRNDFPVPAVPITKILNASVC